MHIDLIPLYSKLQAGDLSDLRDVGALFCTPWKPDTREEVEQLRHLKQDVVNRVTRNQMLGQLLHYLKQNTSYTQNLPLDLIDALPLDPRVLLTISSHGYPVSGSQYLKSILAADIPSAEVAWYIEQYRDKFEKTSKPERGEEHLLFGVWSKYPGAFIKSYDLSDTKLRKKLYHYALQNSALAVHAILTTQLAADFGKWFTQNTKAFAPNTPWDVETPRYLRRYHSEIYAKYLQNTRTQVLLDLQENAWAAYETWWNFEVIFSPNDNTQFPWHSTIEELGGAFQQLLDGASKNAEHENIEGFYCFIDTLFRSWLPNAAGLADVFLTALNKPTCLLPKTETAKLAELCLDALKSSAELDLDKPAHLELFLQYQNPKSWFYDQMSDAIPLELARKGWYSFTEDHIRGYLTEMYKSSFPLADSSFKEGSWEQRLYETKEISDPGMALAVFSFMAPAWRYTQLRYGTKTLTAAEVYNYLLADKTAAKSYQDHQTGFMALSSSFTELQAFVEYGLQVYRQYKPSLPPPEVCLDSLAP